MTRTSTLTLAAALGLLAGGAMTSANAADLGGGCCADLEERVAELEATTARKGNRVVSLQVYGQVNKALLYFDNGEEDDVFVVDNDYSTSRIGFKGTASIKPGWTAGYNMEFDLFGDSNSNNVSVNDDEGGVDDLRIRKNELWVESERLGRVTLGQGSSAADGINEIVLGNSMIDAGVSYGGNITVVGANVLEDFADNLDGARIDRVRYDTPTIYGFILSASWGEDDVYDVALRFKKEFNSIRIAAGVAYQAADPSEGNASEADEPSETISGSISVMHIPSGIYGAFAAGQKTFDDDDDGVEPSFVYGQIGIEKRFLPYGATTIYGEYGLYDEFGDVNDAGTVGSEATRYGFGITQTIDNAALDLYAQAQFWEFDANNGVGADEDLTLVIVGTRIKF
jgi:predicted porin